MGTLYMIPCPLAEGPVKDVIPAGVVEKISGLKYFVVENVRSARRFIRSVDKEKNIDELQFFVLDKKSGREIIPEVLERLFSSHDVGVVSEAGCPGVADPGAMLVEEAHANGIKVVPLIGPGSILLALMASGMNGQSFAFHGYLPIKDRARKDRIKHLESEIFRSKQTQIFMETPYRNNQLLKEILNTCSLKTKLCIAADITSKDEYIETMTIGDWKKLTPDLHKRPAIFLLGN